MNKDRFIALLAKKQVSEITSDELKEFEHLKLGNPQFTSLQKTVESLKFTQTKNENLQLKERLCYKIAESAKSTMYKHPRKLYYQLIAAAVLLPLILISILVFYNTQNNKVLSKELLLTTQKGNKSNIILPDGTKVWLNSDSRLSYPQKFNSKSREVQLSGEAYFEVVKDKQHPFIVHTNNIDVKVLGTVFNVRNYQNENTIQTTLLKGSVEVYLTSTNKKIALSPNEKLIVEKMKPGNLPDLQTKKTYMEPLLQLVPVKPNTKDSTFSETAWLEDRIIFNSETIEEIIPVLERSYNTTIAYNGVPGSKTFSGSFKNASLEDVMKALKLSGGINYRIDKDSIIIY